MEDDIGNHGESPAQTIESNDPPATLEETPKIGMEFNSEEDAYQFYLSYAKKVGFGVKKHKFHKVSGNMIDRQFVCSAEGQKREDKRNVNVKNLRAITRFGCKAMMKICLRDGKKYQVSKFVSDYNHNLTSPQKSHFFLSHIMIEDAYAAQIDMAECVGLTPKVSYDLMVKGAGG
ncbi:protein FAR1-RELATED SEQUENCE 5-like [Andrographis paniculata]|uniref:protein FAR1-RELATED SEQUENCE 5-like n=1 Tax=Andrographis paniculata TaxID=175694 RepID=UPI0021E75CED|nr:protein FAR1-RELATED SEQUENCE 5-like [Andrographis paniculata]